MSREKRRKGSTRRRRTPAASSSGGGPSIPMVPVVVIMGAVAIVSLIAFLIWQSGKEPGANSEWAEVEADPAPDLPGVFVDLQDIYDGTYGTHGENPTAAHVRRDVDYAGDGNTTPPAGGPHWGSGACPRDPENAPRFCGPAPWGIYREPWEPEAVVHNIEHGGVVIWYNTDDIGIRDELEDIVQDKLGNGEVLVLLPFPDMEEDTIALTSWARIDKFPVGEFTKDRVEDYIDAHVRRFNPEQF